MPYDDKINPELVERLLTGIHDDNAWNEALGPVATFFRPILVRHVARLFPGREDLAEDLVHDFFIKKLRVKLENYKDNNFDGWIGKVAWRVGIDEWRKVRRVKNKVAEKSPEELSLPAPVEDDKEEHALLAEDIVGKLKEDLGPEMWEVIDLEFFEKKSTKDIAQLFGTEEVNIRMRRHRAIQKLRLLLQEKQYAKDYRVIIILAFLEGMDAEESEAKPGLPGYHNKPLDDWNRDDVADYLEQWNDDQKALRKEFEVGTREMSGSVSLDDRGGRRVSWEVRGKVAKIFWQPDTRIEEAIEIHGSLVASPHGKNLAIVFEVEWWQNDQFNMCSMLPQKRYYRVQ